MKALVIILFLMFPILGLAQVTVSITVTSGNSGTSCDGGSLFGTPRPIEPHWGVNIDGQGWTTYPSAGLCFTDPSNLQYSEVFNCPSYPATLQVCFRAFEDDPISPCVVNAACLEEICGNFTTPAIGFTSNESLTIPNNGGNSSWGTVNFEITVSGSFPDDGNDLICNAENLGTLNSGTVNISAVSDFQGLGDEVKGNIIFSYLICNQAKQM